MVVLKIKRTVYTRATQDAIAKYARKVLSKTFENPTYAKMAEAIADLKEKSDTYDAALLAAAEGGTGLVAKKNQAKKMLIAALDSLVNLAEVYCEGSEDYITDMGFTLRGKERRSRLPLIAPMEPVSIVVESTGRAGELRVRFVLPNKEHVVNVAVEDRIANVDVPFQNGRYMDGEDMILKGFPQLKMIELRFKALGREFLTSEWTTSVFAPVL